MNFLMAVLFNCLAGVLFAATVGTDPVTTMAVANGMGLIAGAVPQMSGVLRAGVLKEVWTGELIKALRAGLEATWLDGIPDASSLVDNDVIHLVEVGVDPDVLINNTSYPIAQQSLTDTDKTIPLDKYQTKATPVTDDELYALSYDKMARVKESHSFAINDAKFKKAAHALAPASTSIKTSGAIEGGGASGRKRITRTDIIALKKAFDAAKVPTTGRRLVLCQDHVNDLLLEDQKFADQYYNYTTGKIANLYGFEVYEFANCPLYTTAGNKKNFGTSASTGEYQASFAFYAPRVFKATGSTKMYFSEAATDPQNQQNLINFRHYFVALPKKADAMGAIVSDYVAPVSNG